MKSVPELLAAARENCLTGSLHEAEKLCQLILGSDARVGEAWYLLAGIAQRTGRVDRAIEYGQRAAALMPTSAAALSDLGTSYLLRGRVDEAVAVLRSAVDLRPDAEALHFNLGNSLRIKGSRQAAIDCYRKATQLKPTFVDALCNLAGLLQEEGELEEALVACRDALVEAPENPFAYVVMGNVLKSMGQIDEAAGAYVQALQINPSLVEALAGLGGIYEIYGKYDEAIQCSTRALELNPRSALALSNLGAALSQIGKLQSALDCFCKAIELQQDHVDAHLNRAGWLLLHGDFARGWTEYEWRWKANGMRERQFGAAPWKGETLADRTILLHAEQGFGDTLQFVRYANVVKQMGAKVVLECAESLQPLLRSCRGIDVLVVQGKELPELDFHCPLLSLPRVLKTEAGTIPADVPYLSVSSERIQTWQEQLQALQGFRVGINWRGRRSRGVHQRRDIPLELLAELASVPGVQLISLQRDAEPEELAAAKGRVHFVAAGSEFDKAHGAFVDTAAILSNLDLVISSDTSIAHLAGALGCSVWLLLPFLPDWRWQLQRSDSPWYPSMRIFRQHAPGDWRGVIAEVSVALCATVAGKVV